MEYILENFSLDDELLKNAAFVNFEKKLESDPLQAEYFVKRYMYFYSIIASALMYTGVRNFYHLQRQLK